MTKRVFVAVVVLVCVALLLSRGITAREDGIRSFDVALQTPQCFRSDKFFVVSLPNPVLPSDLVCVRRMCEIAGPIFPSFALRIYSPRALSSAEQDVLQVRCKMCYEVWVSSDALRSKFHVLLDRNVSVGLMRSVHSRPNRRELHGVGVALSRYETFHSFRDHPKLHSQLEPHLWGFQKPRIGLSQPCVSALLNCSFAVGGEPAFLACLWTHCMRSEGFLVVDESKLEERLGFDYIGRLADHRERDMQNGWMSFRDEIVKKPVTHRLLKCVERLDVSSSRVEWMEGERRFLSYVLYGSREVDRVALKQTLSGIAEREVYWGWNVALFVDSQVELSYLKELLAIGLPFHAFLVKPDNSPECALLKEDKMMWRSMLPTYFSVVDRFVVRDADSPIRAREWHAVREWIASGLNLHFMRDSVIGHNHRVMGGMWGSVGKTYLDQADHFLDHAARFYGNDQWFLGGTLWRLHNDSQLSHDSHTCILRQAIPFPSPAHSQHFVGDAPSRYTDIKSFPDDQHCESKTYDAFLA